MNAQYESHATARDQMSVRVGRGEPAATLSMLGEHLSMTAADPGRWQDADQYP